MVFGFSQKASIGDFSENGVSGRRENGSHLVVRSREDGTVETVMRQFLGSFAVKEK